MRAFLRLEAQLCRWRFNLDTGAVKEEQLDDAKTNGRRSTATQMGRKSRYAYNWCVPRYEGLVKYDTERGTSEISSVPGHLE